jgi:5-methylthioadenosine/S-adenosylhomocysteine deaminase
LSEQLIRDLVGLAREYEVGIHGHVAVEDWGETTYLDDLALLGPDLLFAHGFRTTARDLALIAHYNVKISHSPGASAHGGYGVAVVGQIPEMLQRGICVCLGSDSAAGGNKLDVLRQAYLAAVLHKEARQDATAVAAETALQMATTYGAKAIRNPDIGFLATGAKADIVVVDASQLHLLPSHSLTNNIVYSGSRSDVITTIVDGRVLMEDRHVLVMDEAEVSRQSSERAYEIARKWRERLAIEYPGMETPR